MSIDEPDATRRVRARLAGGSPGRRGHRSPRCPRCPRWKALLVAAAVAHPSCGEDARLLTDPAFSVSAAGTPATLAYKSGNNQVGAAPMKLAKPLAVKVTDGSGAAVQGVTVDFAVTAGGGSLSAAAPRTNASGVASTMLTLGPAAGTNTVRASVAGLAPLDFTATGRVPAEIRVASGDNQSAVVGSVLPAQIVAQVVDGAGKPVPGIRLSFRVTYNIRGSAVTPTQVVTDANGKAKAKYRLSIDKGLNQAEAYIATGPYSGLHPATFVNETGLFSWGTVATGLNHTCGIAHNGTDPGPAYCWGWNIAGAVGDGTTVNRVSPALVANGSLTFIDIAAGAYHTCALSFPSSEGNVWCWGSNTSGEFGNSANQDATSPVGGGGRLNFVSLVAGANHTCGLQANGTAYCWGANGSGQLGDGTTTSRNAPVRLPGTTPWIALTAGVAHTCGIRQGGSLYCWGSNQDGRLGIGTAVAQVTTPTLVSGTWKTVDAGLYHTCATAGSGDNRVLCWGRNWNGQLGDGTTTSRSTPTSTVPTSYGRLVAGGGRHTCAVRWLVDAVDCWGANDFGQVGDNTTTQRTSPASVPGSFAAIHAGSDHTCGARGAAVGHGVQELHCWGLNSSGQLGIGSTSNVPTPVRVIDP